MVGFDDASKPRSASVRLLLVLALTPILVGTVDAEPTQQSEPAKPSTWRQPVGLALDDSGRFLFCTLREHRELVAVDLTTKAIVARHRYPGRPETLTGSPGGLLIAPDAERDRLYLVRWKNGGFHGEREIATGLEPKRLATSRDGRSVFVVLRLGQAVEAYDLDAGVLKFRTDLDFPAHCLALSPDGSTLLVADAFRGAMAALDPNAGTVLRRFNYPAHNLRGLAFARDGASFFFTCQILSETSHITRDAVFWGAAMTNNLRRVMLATFLDPQQNPLKHSRIHYLGDSNRGAGDPADIAVSATGQIALLLSGVDQLAVDHEDPFKFDRLDVGKRPAALLIDPTGATAYVANRYDDSISVVDLKGKRVTETISLGPKAEPTAAMRGEVLFHDARVSLDGWYSCQSCHTNGQTHGSNADTLGDGGFGAPKNIPSLIGVGQTKPWAWNGQFETLEEQIASSITKTMRGARRSSDDLADIAAYLRTLTARKAPPRDPELVARGKTVFGRLDCARCHQGATYTSGETYDVGLDDGLAGNREFNPPSLRGLARSAPYFHDGRAPTLDAVLQTHRHQLEKPLPKVERQALVAFLKSL